MVDWFTSMYKYGPGGTSSLRRNLSLENDEHGVQRASRIMVTNNYDEKRKCARVVCVEQHKTEVLYKNGRSHREACMSPFGRGPGNRQHTSASKS